MQLRFAVFVHCVLVFVEFALSSLLFIVRSGFSTSRNSCSQVWLPGNAIRRLLLASVSGKLPTQLPAERFV
jgi:hypothetical protein